ncbi:MAG: glycosyltransferase family 39 protein [Anaerolineae bacterium]|nr:glycosyltransferase family 39 protein [Anaerolineae bacterium]
MPRFGLHQRDLFRWGLLPCLLLATVLALPGLRHDLLWSDEVLTLSITGGGRYGEKTPAAAFLEVVRDGVWPPLYTAQMYVWGRLAGWSELAGRALALLTGLLCVPVVYRLGKALYDARAGGLAALLLVTNSFFIHYLHEMRGYTLYLLTTAAGVWLYWHLLARAAAGRPLRGRHRVLFVAALTGMLYSHYVAAGVFGGLLLYHELFQRRHPGRRWLRRQFSMALLLYVPWLFLMIQAVLFESTYARPISSSVILSSVYGFSNGLPLWVAAVALYALWWLRSSASAFLLFWSAVALAVALLVDRQVDFLFNLRHVLFLLLPLVVFSGMALSHRLRRGWWWGLLALVWIVPGVLQTPSEAFMRELPGQVKQLPVALQTAVQSQAACFNQAAAVFLVDAPAQETLHQIVLAHYFSDLFPRLATFDLLQNIPERLPPSAAPYAERAAAFINHPEAQQLWLIALRDVPAPPALPAWEALAMTRYPYCAMRYQSDTLFIRLYSRTDTVTCADQTVPVPDCSTIPPVAVIKDTP